GHLGAAQGVRQAGDQDLFLFPQCQHDVLAAVSHIHGPESTMTSVRTNSLDVKAVVFDIGGVLLDWDPRHLYRNLFADEATMEGFLAEICTPAWHAAHDRGLPTAPSCVALAGAHPEFAREIMAWAERSEEMVAGDIPGTAIILDELKA